jgi:hypothetical protein
MSDSGGFCGFDSKLDPVISVSPARSQTYFTRNVAIIFDLSLTKFSAFKADLLVAEL